jgi:hypothetical protein
VGSTSIDRVVEEMIGSGANQRMAKLDPPFCEGYHPDPLRRLEYRRI